MSGLDNLWSATRKPWCKDASKTLTRASTQVIETEFTSMFNNLGQVLTREDDGSKISSSLIVSYDETNLYDAKKCLFTARGGGGYKPQKGARQV